MIRIKYIFQVWALLFLGSTFSQGWSQNTVPLGQWKSWSSYKSCIQTTWRDGMYYTLTTGGVFSFDPEELEVKTYSTVDGLTGLNGTMIQHDSIHDQVVVGYEDGMINFFQTPDKVEVMSDIFRTQLYGNKKINGISYSGSYLYIATGFGVVQYDMILKETRNTFVKIGSNDAGANISSVFVFGDKIFAATPTGLFSAPLSFPNLADSKAWSGESVMNQAPVAGSTRFVTGDASALYCNYQDTVYRYTPAEGWSVTPLENGTYNSLDFRFGVLCATFGERINALFPDGFLIKANTEKPRSCFPDPKKTRRTYVNDQYHGWWVWDNYYENPIPVTGPENNLCTELAVGSDEFYVAPKGFGVQFDKSGIFYYNRLHGWNNLNSFNGKLQDSKNDMDYVAAYFDERTGDAWLGSFQLGIAQLRKGELITFYDGTNSGIRGRTKETGVETDIRVHDLKMDSQNNLWFTTEYCPTPLQVKTASGYWYAYSLLTSPDNVKWLEIDDNGYKWIAVENVGIIVYDDKGAPDAQSTHRQRILNTTAGQGSLPSNFVNCIVKDRNGRIWIGTSTGVAVFNNPRGVFSNSSVDAQRPVFNRRPLFTNEAVTCIAVDGQNRKWIGTRNGVYLMSEDGTEQLATYTMDNSPLFSNNIQSISINGKSGEVFISTDLGLVSLMGEATEPTATCDSLLVFPNPFYPEVHESVSIRGTTANSVVRITTETGMLVKELNTLGGQAVWNGRDVSGNSVYPGVYLIMAADADNQNSCIAKMAVIPKP